MTKKAEGKTSLKVLYLEDSPQDVELMRELLLEAKFDLSMDCTAAEEEFISLLRSRKYEIILADFKLAGFDAFAALRWAKDVCPDVPFICVSGSIGEETAVELLKQGAVDYILKDRLGRLPSAIKRALKEVKEKKALQQAEDALRESETRFRQIAEQSQTMIWEVDSEGLYTYVSPISEIILGYRPDEIVGKKHFYDLHPAEGREAFKQAAFETFAQKALFHDFLNRAESKDGKVLFLNTNGMPMLDAEGNLQGYRGSDSDITERKRSEDVLRQSEARFRILFEQAADIILQLEINSEGIPVIREANSATLRILGYERDELIGQPVSFIEGAPDASKVVAERRQNVLSGIDKVFEAKHRCKDGTILGFECSIAEMQFGAKTFAISVERDITERKRTEKKIKENLEEKEVLLREIHHRVKNNLMVIYGLLAMQEAGKQHKDLPTLITDIKNRIFSMAMIHESLYKSGNLTMIDPALYIQSLIANMSIALCLVPGQISFHQEVQDGLQFDMDTAAPLGLIFNELLTNAMKHAFPGDRTGEITIRLFKTGEEADAAKRPAGADDRRKYTLLVADNGVGLPKNWNEETTETMGTHLVQLLARQIAGSVAWKTEGGTVCRIDFSTKEK